MKLLGEIIGHNNIIGLLRKAVIYEQVAHAYLFSGSPGVGKKTSALAFARSLLCSQPQQGDACTQCRECQQVEGGNHPDLVLIAPAANSIKIDQVRELQSKAMLAPYQGQRQVFLIEQAESMTAEAANCLLKVLEEPPPGVVFILISDQPYALFPTIVSRCQQIFFQPLSLSQVIRGLKEETGISDAELRLPAILSGGSLGQALTIITDGIKNKRNPVIELAGKLPGSSITDICRLASKLQEEKGSLVNWLDMLSLWYRDLLLWQETGLEELLVNRDCLPSIQEQTEYYSTTGLIKIISEIEQAKNHLRTNANTRLSLEVLLIHIVSVSSFEKVSMGVYEDALPYCRG